MPIRERRTNLQKALQKVIIYLRTHLILNLYFDIHDIV